MSTLQKARITTYSIGSINFTIFFLFWLSIGWRLTSNPSSGLPIMALFLIPPSLLVGWRGVISARMILAAKDSVWHAAKEGFGWGTIIAIIAWSWGLSNAVLAAGTGFDGLSPTQLNFWVMAVETLLPIIGFFGTLGSIHSITFLLLNRTLIKISERNKVSRSPECL
ncbi:hypothetical protein OL229_08910 [Neisseriaceae bacterium JH1-16]|nr:hypothetical protein [Neisseriaceae bacterium JH1-16]